MQCTIIDTDRYPRDDFVATKALRQNWISDARQRLAVDGCRQFPGFIKPDALALMTRQTSSSVISRIRVPHKKTQSPLRDIKLT